MVVATNSIEFNFRTEKCKEYENILNRKLTSLECKHIISLKNKSIYDASVRAGYQWVVFGSHRNGSLESEEIIINEMTKDNHFNRPIRIVYAKDNKLWADNTHTAMSYINRFGENVCIKDIPFYLIDIRKEVPIVVSINNSVNNNLVDIYNAIACAERINERLDNGVRPLYMHWTINDLKSEFDTNCKNFNVINSFIRSFYTEPIIDRITSARKRLT